MDTLRRFLQPRRGAIGAAGPTGQQAETIEIENRLEAAEDDAKKLAEDLAVVRAKAQTWQRRYH